MGLSELTKDYDKKKVELERAQEQTAALDRELDQLRRQIGKELGFGAEFNGRATRKTAGERGTGTKRITKERVHSWLSEAATPDKGMTMAELVKAIETSTDGFNTDKLESRLEPLLKEVATKKSDRYLPKAFKSRKGRKAAKK